MIRDGYQSIGMKYHNDKENWLNNDAYRTAFCALHTFVFEADFFPNTFHIVKKNPEDIFRNVPDSYEEAFEGVCTRCHEDDLEKFKATFAPSEIQRAWNRGERKCSMECQLQIGRDPNQYKWFYCAVLLFGDERGRLKGVIGCGRDRNNRKEKEAVVTYQASHDALTDTLNWRAGAGVLDRYMKVNTGRQAAFLLLDIDDFKLLNDTYGYTLGDQILKQMADIIKEIATTEACITRYSGTKFIVFFEMENAEQVRQMLNEMIQKVSEQLKISTENGELCVTTSIGVSLYPKHGKTTERLQECAEYALRYSKLHGKNSYALYDRKMEYLEDKKQVVKEEDLLRWEDADDIIYMSNPVTHELYYVNRVGRQAFGLGNNDYQGRKCYEVLQGRPEPCPFCKKCRLEENDGAIVWEHTNEKIHRKFLVKDRLIMRDGRQIHVEQAIDISNKE